eukprot:scaffold64767_cov56-Phaeocystis_antarctica.AAC.4
MCSESQCVRKGTNEGMCSLSDSGRREGQVFGNVSAGADRKANTRGAHLREVTALPLSASHSLAAGKAEAAEMVVGQTAKGKEVSMGADMKANTRA